jgi:hypothetical protein
LSTKSTGLWKKGLPRAIEAAIENHLALRKKTRLLVECRKLDPSSERELADESLAADASGWPEY